MVFKLRAHPIDVNRMQLREWSARPGTGELTIVQSSAGLGWRLRRLVGRGLSMSTADVTNTLPIDVSEGPGYGQFH
ncbi:hypothetical protein [Burkholderia sp. PU8-34]